jgi:hypothetical protein
VSLHPPALLVDVRQLLMKFRNGLFLADVIHVLFGAKVVQVAGVPEPFEEVQPAHAQSEVEVGLPLLLHVASARPQMLLQAQGPPLLVVPQSFIDHHLP